MRSFFVIIMGRRILNLLHFNEQCQENSVTGQQTLVGRIKYLSTLLKNYWHIWSKNYLTSLQEFHGKIVKYCLYQGG